jgi:hypothetical protein
MLKVALDIGDPIVDKSCTTLSVWTRRVDRYVAMVITCFVRGLTFNVAYPGERSA